MTRPRPIAVLVFAAAVFVTGCAQIGGLFGLVPAGTATTQPAVLSPLQQTVAAREAYTAALTALNAAHSIGYLSVDEKVRVEPYRQAAADGLDRMEAAALAGDKGAPGGPYAAALAGFNQAMAEVARYQIKARQAETAVERVRAEQAKRKPVTGRAK